MQFIRDLFAIVSATWAEWDQLRLDQLLYSEVTTARQILLALIGLAAIFVVIRSFGSRNPGHHRMALPALVKSSGWSRASLSRHGALLLALAGLPFFIISLADPRTALTRSETTFPGPPHRAADRRIFEHAVALAVDDARQRRAEQRGLLHHRRRRPLFHRAAHVGQVSRPDGPRSSSATTRT
jgi:hypothetical protein